MSGFAVARSDIFIVVSQKVKKELQTRSLFVVVVVVLYDVRSIIYLYSFILYVYITFVISIRAREENPIGDIICVEFSSFEKPLRGFKNNPIGVFIRCNILNINE